MQSLHHERRAPQPADQPHEGWRVEPDQHRGGQHLVLLGLSGVLEDVDDLEAAGDGAALVRDLLAEPARLERLRVAARYIEAEQDPAGLVTVQKGTP
ncbi:MAG TPA: hypothetical protein VJS45_07605 [Acidimicrobiia bacterium]|nr:hypothetical protein [Acidimicrobiia bacterium]